MAATIPYSQPIEAWREKLSRLWLGKHRIPVHECVFRVSSHARFARMGARDERDQRRNGRVLRYVLGDSWDEASPVVRSPHHGISGLVDVRYTLVRRDRRVAFFMTVRPHDA